MERRDLIKASIFTIGALGAFSLTGCNNKTQNKQYNFKNHSPKSKIAHYNITAPLPFNYSLIDEMKELNSKFKKSKIKTLYNSIPFPLANSLETYHSRRGINKNIKTIDDFIKYVKYAKSLGFDFVYTLNSPKPFSDHDFKKTKDELFYLLDKLKDNKIDKLKISNTQLLNVLSEKYPSFELQASTAFEFHNVNQYINLLKNYPNIKLLDIAIDENRNFKFLKSLKELFPNVELELMVNEPCLRGCPSRISHCATTFCEFDCMKIIEKNWIEEFCKSGVIYPWNLDYYTDIKINRFKLISSGFVRANIENLDWLKGYLSIVEEGIENYDSEDFFKTIIKFSPNSKKIKKIALKEIVKYLPDINYFIENGDKCAQNCTTNCTYCIECAQKLREILS